mmetsp:Transcript_33808/g.98304  ORF Transcript_33808/g.98304 Transcript_33808/m.98304 type:complete len:276 (+) Transcript_33808:844-1671(+)
MTSVIFSLTMETRASSRSAAATAETTSHNTPMSMFITMRAANAMNNMKITAKIGWALPMSSKTGPRLSRNTPVNRRLYMDLGMLPKRLTPAEETTGLPDVNCVNAMANMYSKMTRSTKVNTTDLVAAIMPLIKIMSSGIVRNMRAKRDNRSNRNNRNIEALKKSGFPPASSKMEVMTHVSMTIKKTKAESKQNHPSFKQFRLISNDAKRTYNSKLKNIQKKCSTIWYSYLASSKLSALLVSVSIHIQKALTTMTNMVRFSKIVCVAIHGKMPSFL